MLVRIDGLGPPSAIFVYKDVKGCGYGPFMGEGTLPTEEVVERRDGERPAFGPLFSASC